MFTGRMRMREPGDLRAERERDALVGLHREDQLVGLHADRALRLERQVRHRLELDGDLGDLAREPLARAQHDRHARPSASCGPPGAARRRSRSASRPGRRPPRGSPWPPRRPRRPRCTARARSCAATSSGVGGVIASSTLTFSSRTLSASKDDGGSMHTSVSSCSMWFWTRSRSAPELVVVARARADPDVLGGGDLDVVDEVAVPDRLEHVVGEPERHHVLDGLLAQVVVDAVDLLLAERARRRSSAARARTRGRCRTASR